MEAPRRGALAGVPRQGLSLRTIVEARCAKAIRSENVSGRDDGAPRQALLEYQNVLGAMEARCPKQILNFPNFKH